MGAWPQKVEMFTLAMHIDQVASDIAQQLQIDHPPVDATDIATRPPHLAAEGDPIRIVRIVQPILF